MFSFFSGLHKASAEDVLNINADAAILVDAETGRVLYEKNPDQVLGIASMTKMMTEYLLLEAIKEGSVKWDQEYSVSDYVYNVLKTIVHFQMYLYVRMRHIPLKNSMRL